MKVKDFYENMKDIIQDQVTIMDGIVEEYSDYMYSKKVYEFLFDYDIKSIHIGDNETIVVEI